MSWVGRFSCTFELSHTVRLQMWKGDRQTRDSTIIFSDRRWKLRLLLLLGLASAASRIQTSEQHHEKKSYHTANQVPASRSYRPPTDLGLQRSVQRIQQQVNLNSNWEDKGTQLEAIEVWITISTALHSNPLSGTVVCMFIPIRSCLF